MKSFLLNLDFYLDYGFHIVCFYMYYYGRICCLPSICFFALKPGNKSPASGLPKNPAPDERFLKYVSKFMPQYSIQKNFVTELRSSLVEDPLDMFFYTPIQKKFLCLKTPGFRKRIVQNNQSWSENFSSELFK